MDWHFCLVLLTVIFKAHSHFILFHSEGQSRVSNYVYVMCIFSSQEDVINTQCGYDIRAKAVSHKQKRRFYRQERDPHGNV